MFKVCVVATLAIVATLAEAGLIGSGLALGGYGGGYGGAYGGHGVDYYVSTLMFADFCHILLNYFIRLIPNMNLITESKMHIQGITKLNMKFVTGM